MNYEYVLGEALVEKTVGKATLSKLGKVPETEDGGDKDSIKPVVDHASFKDIVAFLKPANDAVQAVIKDAALNNPNILKELISVNFSDLLKVFKYLLSHSESIENAYRKLFLGVEKFGAEQFVESVIRTLSNSEDDSSKKESLDSISQVISSYVEENKASAVMEVQFRFTFHFICSGNF